MPLQPPRNCWPTSLRSMCFGLRTVPGQKHLPWLPRTCPGQSWSSGPTHPQGWNSCCTSLPETLFSRSLLNLQRSWDVALQPLQSRHLAAKDRKRCDKTALGRLHPLAFMPMTDGRAHIDLTSAAANPISPTLKNGGTRAPTAVFRVQCDGFRSAQPSLLAAR
jgi:hypothetical protein